MTTGGMFTSHSSAPRPASSHPSHGHFCHRISMGSVPKTGQQSSAGLSPSSLLQPSLHRALTSGVQLLQLYLLLLFVLDAIGWSVMSQGLTVQPILIPSSLSSCLSFWSDSMPGAYCSMQTHQGKLFRLFNTAGRVQQKKDRVSPLILSIFMILFNINFLGISFNPH